jgi:YbbR domain-containing protein
MDSDKPKKTGFLKKYWLVIVIILAIAFFIYRVMVNNYCSNRVEEWSATDTYENARVQKIMDNISEEFKTNRQWYYDECRRGYGL